MDIFFLNVKMGSLVSRSEPETVSFNYQLDLTLEYQANIGIFYHLKIRCSRNSCYFELRFERYLFMYQGTNTTQELHGKQQG